MVLHLAIVWVCNPGGKGTEFTVLIYPFQALCTTFECVYLRFLVNKGTLVSV
jgi:hypothetical protein